jgi:hypothetical protein
MAKKGSFMNDQHSPEKFLSFSHVQGHVKKNNTACRLTTIKLLDILNIGQEKHSYIVRGNIN